ncbi:hypothetical protein AB0N09_36315 [Streptomyces erythrochromogenes]|uniref:hypothetical protein n=1 Tax=Streptomyces erythrochromogenes TaxID=285574 RepID=UPI00343E8A61
MALQVLRTDFARRPHLAEDALGRQMPALLRQLKAVHLAADDLAETGDDRNRFADARSRTTGSTTPATSTAEK